jgi:two-component system, chemotaxis family, sensor kinase CheA
MAFSLGEYQDIFLEEADDQIQELNKNLLEMEKNSEDEDIINNIFRAAHSLKSSAAFVGLNDLSDLAHKMENLLQSVRDKSIKINQEIIDLLFKCFDHINSVIESVSNGREPDIDLSGIIREISQTSERAKGAGRGSGAAKADKAQLVGAAVSTIKVASNGRLKLLKQCLAPRRRKRLSAVLIRGTCVTKFPYL